ncbi:MULTISPECIES: cytidine deaminase [Microbispora]|uniref:Cytidine deaminase n=1 Tax=Microbispora siamensis TaxID=564413 RepID=A0ABQ4GEU5_9ACTN|nr:MULTISPECIES: cytidine deaminase [Microbispora]MBE3010045.1 cytidine deaminase [Microbispora sitophila]GIH59943.1 cytidine deaminase [Microbispora siamensis]
MTQTLDPEDNKIITLARSARARGGTPEGAAVRDETGRTYAATTVALPSLRLSALQAAVAMAVSSGAKALEAAAIVTEADDPAEQDLAVVEDMGNGTLFLAAPDGSLKGRYI